MPVPFNIGSVSNFELQSNGVGIGFKLKSVPNSNSKYYYYWDNYLELIAYSRNYSYGNDVTGQTGQLSVAIIVNGAVVIDFEVS